jgi:glycyl-tRNA synthetase alpha chain
MPNSISTKTNKQIFFLTFNEIILKLSNFWANQGCALLQPYDNASGAGTFHPATFLKSLDKKPWACAYTAPCRRPSDSRYGQNPNRLGTYYQYQVLIKPAPSNIQDLYIKSLEVLGLNTKKHDIRFVEDNWESPTLGAWGLGWEVWIDGMEVTQFTYFQQVGGLVCDQTPIEITYGTERLAMYLQNKDNIFDIVWSKDSNNNIITYKDIHFQNEVEFSKYSLAGKDTKMLFKHFEDIKIQCTQALNDNLSLIAYDFCISASHIFNLLDARGAISVARRQEYILQIRELSKACAVCYVGLKDDKNNS